ncbi:MAG: hypothetical protein ABSG93_01260 [Solirubrobacteraceae bacterium]|jgi:hypothetical protein
MLGRPWNHDRAARTSLVQRSACSGKTSRVTTAWRAAEGPHETHSERPTAGEFAQAGGGAIRDEQLGAEQC